MSFWKKTLDVLPTALASRLFGSLSEIQFVPRVQAGLNRAFARVARINLDEAEKPVEEYTSLGDFFTRGLKPGAREIAAADVVCPVDGKVNFVGRLSKGCLVEAKGNAYSVRDLVGTHKEELTDWLDDAYAFTVYLSPANYHRIHMPMTGSVTHMAYAPGRLLPVNRLGYLMTDDLLPENERLTSFISGKDGHRCALVKVGAACVGKITVEYDGFVTNASLRKTPFCHALDTPWEATVGDPLACFHLGSTIVLLVSSKDFTPSEAIQHGQRITMGTALGNWNA